jgi:hypothetical protein|tara:strand:- start:148 stop:348 length:201 start_codon:yes stop_codon:yes gene_type:complete
MDYLFLAISLVYTTLVVVWLMNHMKTIYNHQFDITDQILRKLSSSSVVEPESKDYLYGVVYPLEEE